MNGYDCFYCFFFFDDFLIIRCIPLLNAYNKIIVMMMLLWLNHCNQNNLPIRAFYRYINKNMNFVRWGTQTKFNFGCNSLSVWTQFSKLFHYIGLVLSVSVFLIFRSVKIVIYYKYFRKTHKLCSTRNWVGCVCISFDRFLIYFSMVLRNIAKVTLEKSLRI